MIHRVNGYHPRILTNPNHLNTATLVYAIVDGDMVKIGKSTCHPIERLHALQTANPRPLLLLAYTSTLTEAQAHKKLAKHRVRGEWFRIGKAVLDEITTWDWLNEKLHSTICNPSFLQETFVGEDLVGDERRHGEQS